MNFSDNYRDLTLETMQEIEMLCTQEQVPFCTSLCPMHVDIREISRLLDNEDFAGAYALYRKAVLFPKIISKICHEPCKQKCKRQELGGSIEIRRLEETIVKFAYTEQKIPAFLPKIQKKVSIIGGGLRGMTAAYELARKGYKVFIYEKTDKLGGSLHKYTDSKLPAEDLESEIKGLLKYPVEIFYNHLVSLNSIDEINNFSADTGSDIVYISCNSKFFHDSDNSTLLIANTKIVTGSRLNYDTDTAIVKVYDGKSAALTIERTLKGVSVMAGREKEGPYETGLFTNTADIPVEKSTYADTDTPLTKEGALKESRRCLKCECMECVKGCEFMKNYKSYPKKYIREVYNNLSIAMGTHHANKMINTCNLCGQCKSICPNNVDMSKIFHHARKLMVDSNKMPPSAYEFALLDMEYSNGEDFFLARHQSGKTNSEYLFFPSCQLAASEPELLEKVYDDLCKNISGGVGILFSCCGIMANWSGNTEIFYNTVNKLKKEIEKLGNPRIISACPTCISVFREHYGLEATGIWELYADNTIPVNADFKNKNLTIHDACSARFDKNIQKDIRDLGKNLGHNITEKKYTKEITSCCGYGGLMPFVDKKTAEKVTDRIIEDSENEILTYCVNCRDRFLKQNRESYHFLELIYGQDNNHHKWPTWSERQENRKRIKNLFLRKFWNEKGTGSLDCKIFIDKDMEEIIEDRMILRTDIQRAIINANEKNEYFIDEKESCYITSFRPNNVTFWVKYTKFEDGYKILNAYTHRMILVNK
jgi:Fe-S oxidoreductase